MCATCGCASEEATYEKNKENKHGDERNITVSEFKASALKTRVAPKHMPTAMRNVRRTLRVARRK